MAPIVFIALCGGFAKIALSILWPGLSETWATLASWPVAGMRHTVDWLATFPGADIPLPKPAVWMIIAYYALLLSTLVRWRWRPIRWANVSGSLAGCVVLAVLPIQRSFAQFHQRAGDLKVTLLAIGAGQCAVVEPPGAPAVLIDAGSLSLSDLVRKVLGPFLRHEGRREIASVFISHANTDHFSAVADIASAYDVSRIYTSSQFRAQSIDNQPAEYLLRTLDTLDRPPRALVRGESIDVGGGATAQIIWPGEGNDEDANNSSLIVRLDFAGRSILFTGDIEADAERAMLASNQPLHADVLVAPHHGSFVPTTSAFVAAVAPSFIVCSNDRTLTGRQREFDRAMRGRQVFRTHTAGAITIRMTPAGEVSVSPFLAQDR